MSLEREREQLVSYLMAGVSPKSMVNLCAKLIGTPIALYTYSGAQGLVTSQGFPGDKKPNILFLNVKLREESAEYAPEELMALRAKLANRPFIREAGKKPEGRYLLCSSVYGDQTAALCCLPEMDIPLENLNAELISLCAQFIALSVIHSGMPSFLHVRQAMRLLLNAPDASYSDIMRRAAPYAPPGKGPYRLMVLQSKRNSAHASQSVQFLCGQLSDWLSSEWIYRTDDSAAILYASQSFPQRERPSLESILEISGCCACVSPDFSVLTQARSWYQRIYRLPAFLQASAGQCVLFSDWMDFGIFTETALPADDLLSFVMPKLFSLRQWDKDHDTDYFHTLCEYIACGCNQKKTASSLSVHVNTLNYRLRKIAEQSDIHTDEPGALYRLPLSIRLMQYLDAALR
ncbi:MAG: helix-turn-helix domain-containing protein [Clostridia bacterium]|nr:helix-turn-helix domain-containing protein [Clostridia bacterium]